MAHESNQKFKGIMNTFTHLYRVQANVNNEYMVEYFADQSYEVEHLLTRFRAPGVTFVIYRWSNDHRTYMLNQDFA